MSRLGKQILAKDLAAGLMSYHQNVREIPGICDSERLDSLVKQMVASIRRIEYVTTILARDIGESCADPSTEFFDPLKASVVFKRRNQVEEAFWMVFLFVHFGKHAKAGWRYAREIYGQFGSGNRWDWISTSTNPQRFREWLNAHLGRLTRPGIARGFGNHRKYISLNAFSQNGTGAAFETYVNWIGPSRTHSEAFEQAKQLADGEPQKAFHELYLSMDKVATFGRTARFDYLTMVAKLKLAPIEPGSPYISGSTGPLQGARLLYGVGEKPALLNQLVADLGSNLGVDMQVIEDALCNWQKSPDTFKHFKG